MRVAAASNAPRQAARAACIVLAALAMALKVLIPAGFMTAPRTNDLPFPLVLCTGQGAMVVAPGQALPGSEEPGPDERQAHDSPCAFAGHGLAAPAPNLLDAGRIEFIAYDIEIPSNYGSRLAPGRGLAAPPPPARGPPGLLI